MSEEVPDGNWYLITEDTYCTIDNSLTKSMKNAYNETICADEFGEKLNTTDCMSLVLDSHCGLSLSYHDSIKNSFGINDQLTSLKALRYNIETQ